MGRGREEGGKDEGESHKEGRDERTREEREG